MLVIRRKQMEALGALMLREFEEQMLNYLRSAFPVDFERLSGPDSDRERVRAFIGRGVKKAAVHQIEAEGDVARYIELMVRFGPDFEDREDMAWAKEMLQCETVSGLYKTEWIYDQLPARMAQNEGVTPAGGEG